MKFLRPVRRHCLTVASLVTLLAMTYGCRTHSVTTVTAPLEYPVSHQSEDLDNYHGTQVADPYSWLEDLESPMTQDWVEAQNQLSQPYLDSLSIRPYFVDRLVEMSRSHSPGRLQKQGRFWIDRKRESDGTARYFVQEDLDAPPRILLDPADLSLGPNDQIDEVRISPDGRYLAYTVSSGGKDLTELRIHDLFEDRDLDDRILGLKFSMPYWTADSQGLLYWRYQTPGNDNPDGIDRDSYVAYHEVGTPFDQDLVLARSDSTEVGATLWSQLSADGRFVLLFDQSGFESRLLALDLIDPTSPQLGGPIVALTEAREAMYTWVGNMGPDLYFLATEGSPMGRVVTTRLGKTPRWKTVIPETEHLLQHALIADGRLVVAYREDVQSALKVFELDGVEVRRVDLPAPGSTFYYGGAPDSPDLTYNFDAFAHPASRYRHDLKSGVTSALAAPELDIDLSDYRSHQVFYSSADGTRIPLFLTHRADLKPSGDTPTLLHGYGAAGVVNEPLFADDWFAWIEAGGILAVANIRGGGEYGETWHRDGMLENKQNTYDDFIAAAEFLMSEGYTSPNHLAALGYSNGGMLVGAVITQRPDLFAAAVPVAGVLDALRFPSFTAGPRWARDMGDPAIAEQFEWLAAWSPLHNLRDGTCYPATLVATASNDDLVHPSQSYKFAARLQEVQSCDRPVILRSYPLGAHGFFMDPKQAEARADLIAFAAHHTGLETGKTASASQK